MRGDRATAPIVAMSIAGLAWLGVGVVALTDAWPSGSPPAEATTADATEPGAPPPGALGHAELLVAAWLEAGDGATAAVETLVSGDVDLAGVTAGSRYAARTAIVDTATTPDGWTVTVGVEVLRRDGDGYVAAGLHRYVVEVRPAPDGFTAIGLPRTASDDTAR